MTKPKPPKAEDGAYAGDLTPAEAWTMLEGDGAALVDVRTDAEFSYVGRPDLSSFGGEPVMLSWQVFPAMAVNPEFADRLADLFADRATPLLFLCRSGVRSRYAAAAAQNAGFTRTYNILEGFEGDKDGAGHRGTVGGWKIAGLPWSQG